MSEKDGRRRLDGTVVAELGGDNVSEKERRRRALAIAIHELCAADYKQYRFITDISVPDSPVKYILWDSDKKCFTLIWEELYKASQMGIGLTADNVGQKLDAIQQYCADNCTDVELMADKVADLFDLVPDGHFVDWVKRIGFIITVANVINLDDAGYSVDMGIHAGICDHEERDEELADVFDKYIEADIFFQDLKFLGSLGGDE